MTTIAAAHATAVGIEAVRSNPDKEPKSLQEYQAQIVQQMLGNIQDRLSYSSSYEMNFDWSWVPVDAGYVLSVNINWYNQEEPTDPEIPEDAYEKMDEAVDSAFGDIAYNYYDDYSRTDPVG